MDRRDVEKIGLGNPESTSIPTGKPTNFVLPVCPSILRRKLWGHIGTSYRERATLLSTIRIRLRRRQRVHCGR